MLNSQTKTRPQIAQLVDMEINLSKQYLKHGTNLSYT